MIPSSRNLESMSKVELRTLIANLIDENKRCHADYMRLEAENTALKGRLANYEGNDGS